MPFYFLLFFLGSVYAQNCTNSGIPNGSSSCTCPVGWGGADCSKPACGGDLFSSNRSTTTALSNNFPNITASSCSCETDWIGLGCNVCKSANACQAGFTASGHSSPSTTPGQDDGLNSTLVCNSAARVYASGQMSCNVDNPTLQALYPLTSVLNIMRNLDPSQSPIPGTTSFGTAGTAYAQLFYDGVEQFFCSADSCTQTVTDATLKNSTYDCHNLKCSCYAGTSFCGGTPGKLNLFGILNNLGGDLSIKCDGADPSTQQASCNFIQKDLTDVFGTSGLALSGCTFGECVRQNVIDTATNGNSTTTESSHLSGGVIAGLAVVGSLVLFALVLIAVGWFFQRRARRAGYTPLGGARAGINWSNLTYTVAGTSRGLFGSPKKKSSSGYTDDKVILDAVSGSLGSGQMMAVLGPSGAGKTSLVEILAGKHKTGTVSGSVTFPRSNTSAQLRVGFVPQQDVLPAMLTVFEAILFAARLRLPEGISDSEKQERVDRLITQLGLQDVRNVRIGDGRTRGISGGEMRRVSIGVELIASPDVLILDEPTSGLDSVSASRVANLLHSIAHDPDNPTAVIASIHQPSSQLYHTFDSILVLSHGRTVYSGKGGFAPAEHLQAIDGVQRYPQGYNVADYLLEVASDPPLVIFQRKPSSQEIDPEKAALANSGSVSSDAGSALSSSMPRGSHYATTFLTQLEYLSGREWKILRRDKSLFFTHLAVAAILGVFCGGLYYKTGITIAGFQSRVGCLFFLGALIAFSTLSALYNVVEIRPLFLRERSSSYYSPTVWLLARFLFDAIPLRIIPTIVVSTITYWMAGLAHDAASYFKFLFILVLYTLAMTLFNFLLGTLFTNGGIAILLSALTALYQMTFAGFFVHLDAIPPVLRWLQWLCPLKYSLEALSVNEVGSGLMIQDTLEGVPISVSAALIMNTLFGFGAGNYYRDVLVLFAFIAGFGIGVIGVVWIKVRERR